VFVERELHFEDQSLWLIMRMFMKWVSSLDAIMAQCIASKIVLFWSKILNSTTICHHTRPSVYTRIESLSQVLSCKIIANNMASRSM